MEKGIKVGDRVRVSEDVPAMYGVLYPEKSHTYEVTVDNVAMDWQRYEADLAKEIALKVANKYTDPKEAAEYAVSVAQAVAEGLKRK